MTCKPVFTEEMLTMPDGTALYTRTLFPHEPSPGDRFPVVFHRTPYEPPVSVSPFDISLLKRPMGSFLEHGYAVVNQHCRGTGSSEGMFRNMKNERADSLDTLDIIRSKPWYGGEIYLYGASYKSYIHSSYIGTRPRDVKGAVLAVMPANMFYVCYEKTSMKHDLYTMWFTRLYMKNQLDWKEKFTQVKEELKVRPLSQLPERLYGHEVPELTDVFRHNRPDDEFWQSGEGFGDSCRAPESIDIPLLLIGGFYDIHYKGTLDYWERLNPSAKARSAMYIGPWGHPHDTPPEHEELFPGSRRADVEVEWLDHIRLGTPLVTVREGMTTYYRAGDGWRTAEYPGSDSADSLTLYPSADGKLGLTRSSGSRSYDYDPDSPARFPGGSNVFQSANPGLQPQPEPDFRPDVLSFVTEPFESAVPLDGEIKARLEVSSDCPDTAFFVRADIIRDGVTWYLRDTIVTLRDTLGSYTPGSRVFLDFTLDPVAWTVRPGDRLRVDVSSSNFPTYNAHSNTADYWCDARATRIAHNTLYTDGTSFVFSVFPSA